MLLYRTRVYHADDGGLSRATIVPRTVRFHCSGVNSVPNFERTYCNIYIYVRRRKTRIRRKAIHAPSDISSPYLSTHALQKVASVCIVRRAGLVADLTVVRSPNFPTCVSFCTSLVAIVRGMIFRKHLDVDLAVVRRREIEYGWNRNRNRSKGFYRVRVTSDFGTIILVCFCFFEITISLMFSKSSLFPLTVERGGSPQFTPV